MGVIAAVVIIQVGSFEEVQNEASYCGMLLNLELKKSRKAGRRVLGV